MKKAILFTIIVHLACISPIRSQDVLAKQASIDKKAKSTEAVQSDNFNQSERQGVTTNAFENLIHNCVEVRDTKAFDPKQIFILPALSGRKVEMETWKVAQILNLDVIGYNNKGREYDTDLKRKCTNNLKNTKPWYRI